MTANPTQYWIGMRPKGEHYCPNVSLFRFLGYGGIDFHRRNVLEIGFGANGGADLLECQRRGAITYGADLNSSYVEDFSRNNPGTTVAAMNAGQDEIPFNLNFDVIYHRDLIYYLSNDEIEFHLAEAYRNLSKGGRLVFQFIEKDLTVDRQGSNRSSFKLDFKELEKATADRMFRGDVNPIRALDIDWIISVALRIGFTLESTKTVIESYTMDESIYRVDRYLMLQK